MKMYKIFIKKTKENVFEDVVLIKEGFIFWAFLFNIFWLFYKKVWKMGAIILAIFIAINYANKYQIIYPNVILPIQIGVLLIVGFEASDWYGASLKRRGYTFIGHSSGKNADEAQLAFLNEINKKNQKKMKIKIF